MEKSNDEMMEFILSFNKRGEDKDFVEYSPLKVTFKLEGEDTIFKEELDIHKEDIGKMMKRLMNYKFKNLK